MRANLAWPIGAAPAEISFVRYTTEGLNIVANGIGWRPRDNVVLSNIEHPANAYCRLALQRRG